MSSNNLSTLLTNMPPSADLNLQSNLVNLNHSLLQAQIAQLEEFEKNEIACMNSLFESLSSNILDSKLKDLTNVQRTDCDTKKLVKIDILSKGSITPAKRNQNIWSNAKKSKLFRSDIQGIRNAEKDALPWR